jgi:1-deoxy-D-xylulose-5-phosphate reductoisomerase
MSAPKTISILGSTGSIGVNTLNVIKHMGFKNFKVVAITGSSNITLLAKQAKEFGATFAVTADDRHYGALCEALAGTGIQAAAGRGALIDAAAIPVDVTMAAIVGMAGLEPTLAAVKNGNTIALANKECLVCAGALFMDAVCRSGATLLPVDSEHNAIFQVLDREDVKTIARVILTASGGPFRTFSLEQMQHVTLESARVHPNWNMGLKISIDSASMFNKALEMIEAQYLFGLTQSQIEVIIHPQSIVHSMVGFIDGSILAQMGPSDMRVAIGYALNWPIRKNLPVDRLNFAQISQLDFEKPDEVRFPALKLARHVLETRGLSGAVLNAAKEVAVEAFINKNISFLKMSHVVETVLSNCEARLGHPLILDDIMRADSHARHLAMKFLGK